MQKTSRIGYFYLAIILIQGFTFLVQASINDDEDRINSEGMWQKLSPETKQTPMSTGNGNSRLDSGGILVIFPILIPLAILFGIVLFVMSIFGVSPSVLASGRRLDSNEANYDIVDLNNIVLNSEECVERIGCELLQRISDQSTSKKVLRLLRALKVFPGSMDKIQSAGRGPLKCSALNCNFQNFLLQAWNNAKMSM